MTQDLFIAKKLDYKFKAVAGNITFVGLALVFPT